MGEAFGLGWLGWGLLVVEESDGVAEVICSKNVSVVFSESKFGTPYQKFLDPALQQSIKAANDKCFLSC